jgi:hypothetical protein
MKYNIMKFPLLTFASLGALALSSVTTNAQTAVTGALGYYTFDLPAGASMWTCGLVTKSDFSGAMTSMTGASPNSTINQTGAGWTPAGFSNHYVEIREGAWEGLILDIVSNGADSVVVAGDLGASGFNLAGTEKYLIRKHATLGTIFPSGGGFAPDSDSITLYTTGTGSTYQYADGFGWFDTDLLVLAQDTPVYPGQGMVFNIGSITTVTIGGNEVSTVKDTKTLIPLYSGAVNVVGLVNPLVTTDVSDPIYPSTVPLGMMGFTSVLAPSSESVNEFSSDGLLSLVDNYQSSDAPPSGVMFSTISFTDKSLHPIQIGKALVLTIVSNDKYYSAPVLLP